MDPERWQRVVRLYESALERDPAAREEFLMEAAGGDEALRREVESLLAQEATPVVIDRPVLEAAAVVLEGGVSLEPGRQLGPYRIERPIGAGGMGDVYQARDTRLNRTVAVKVLSHALADDPQLRARFEREAKAVAALAHPNICTLHDVGHQDSIDFLVLEYLEGETLAARLERGPLPFDQALLCAIEIAGALDAAHRCGIVHRDLKPANVFLVRGSSKSAPPVAKLLDFGLARPAAPAVLGMGAATADGTPATLTAPGTIIGTVQYMAPEQVEGRETDARTDIFAFGTVVYEMVTGKKAFEGKSEASLIGAIMQADPPALSASQPLTPPLLDRIVKKCLAKEPGERWQSASDIRSELQWVADAGASTALAGAIAPVRRRRETIAWTLAGLLAGAGLLLGLRWRTAGAPVDDRPAARLTVPSPANWSLASARPPNRLAISPDGRRLAFVAENSKRERMLWIHQLDSGIAQPLANTENASSPFWSPDSRFVGFFAGGRIKKIDVFGGPAQTVCDIPGITQGDSTANSFQGAAASGSWNQNGVILFNVERELYRVDPGGKPVLVSSNSGILEFFLPDGVHFVSRAPNRGAGISVGRLDSHEWRPLLTDQVSQPVYAQGHLFYVRDQTLMAQPFDPKRLEFSGEAVPVASPVATGTGGNAAFSVSATGVIAYEAADDVAAPSRLLWFDRRSGKQIGSIGDVADYRTIELSSSGDRLAASIVSPGSFAADLWLFDLSRRLPSRFTSSPADETTAIWSPDDRRIVFGVASPPGLYQKPTDLIGKETQFTAIPNTGPYNPSSWSRDRRFIIYNSGPIAPISILPLEGDRKPIAFAPDSVGARAARFSPVGQWIAYSSRETGREEVYVAPFPGRPGKTYPVSVGGGGFPRWGRDGKELFFLSSDRKLMSAAVHEVDGELRFGAPRLLLTVQVKTPAFGWPYDVSSDGNRVLMIVATTAGEPSITVLVNWPALLKK
jgi:serine/threonine protein kinase